MWYTATSASVNTGENIVSINSGDDLSLVQESSGLIFEGESPVEVIRSYIDTGGNHKIRLASAWPYASKVNEPLITYPTDADFAAATAELRKVLNTMEVASLTEAQEGTEDTKIMTALKTKAAIDFNTGTAAARDVGESAGNVMEVGAFGLGSLNNIEYTDADNVVGYTHFVRFSNTALNIPRPNIYYQGYSTGGSGFQVVRVSEISSSTNLKPRMYERANRNGTWSDWVEIFHTGNIIGTVTQSGGVPTGAIIERGSNANGEYTKFADGTMICKKQFEGVSVSVSTTIGYKSEEVTWNFPKAFSGVFPQVSANANSSSVWVATNMSNTLATIRMYSEVSYSSRILVVTAIGRWY